LLKQLTEPLNILFFTAQNYGAVSFQLPVKVFRYSSLAYQQVVAGGELLDSLIKSLLAISVDPGQVEAGQLLVQLAGHVGMLKQRANFRPEDKALTVGIVIEGADAYLVPGAK
jgi:hypothetical protein